VRLLSVRLQLRLRRWWERSRRGELRPCCGLVGDRLWRPDRAHGVQLGQALRVRLLLLLRGLQFGRLQRRLQPLLRALQRILLLSEGSTLRADGGFGGCARRGGRELSLRVGSLALLEGGALRIDMLLRRGHLLLLVPDLQFLLKKLLLLLHELLLLALEGANGGARDGGDGVRTVRAKALQHVCALRSDIRCCVVQQPRSALRCCLQQLRSARGSLRDGGVDRLLRRCCRRLGSEGGILHARNWPREGLATPVVPEERAEATRQGPLSLLPAVAPGESDRHAQWSRLRCGSDALHGGRQLLRGVRHERH
jgi:hypothetical protein